MERRIGGTDRNAGAGHEGGGHQDDARQRSGRLSHERSFVGGEIEYAFGDSLQNHTGRQHSPWIRLATWAAVFSGLCLRVWQYAAGTSLWLDELAVAQNVVTRPIGRLLLSPLAWDQVAPKGFLLAEKLAVALLGANEYALRLFPLACSVVALILFARVAELVLGRAAPIAVALFCDSWSPYRLYRARQAVFH